MRSRFTATLAASIILLGSRAYAADPVPPPMVSLVQYTQVNSLDGDAAKQFVLMRCGALYAFFASAATANGQKEWGDKLFDTSWTFTQSAQKLEKDKKGAPVRDQVKDMNVAYIKRAEAAVARKGAFSDDPIIRSDTEFCSTLIKR